MGTSLLKVKLTHYRPDEVLKMLVKQVKALAPKNVVVQVKPIHSAPPLLLDTNNKVMSTAADVFSKVFGKKTVYVRSGGSIPVVALFTEHLHAPSVMMGFGLPDDNLHAPNEKFNLSNFYKGAETVARFFTALGGKE